MNVFALRQSIAYRLRSRYRHGFGVHSPFVFDLVTNVLEKTYDYYAYDEVEALRSSLKPKVRRRCLPRKYGQLLFRLVNFQCPRFLLEVGMGDGITAQYLQRARRAMETIYVDHVSEKVVRAALADCPPQVVLFNASLRAEDMEMALPPVLEAAGGDMVLVLSGIGNDREKRRSWAELTAHPKVTLSIDMNRIGLVFFRPEQAKRCYRFRY